METQEQKRNRELAHILMTIYLLSLLKKWRVKQEKYEALEREKKPCKKKNKKKKTISAIEDLLFLLNMK